MHRTWRRTGQNPDRYALLQGRRQPAAALPASIDRSIIGLGHSLELEIIAEGVEAEAQLGFLRKQGCDYMQAFLFSRPLSESDMSGFLARSACLPKILEG